MPTLILQILFAVTANATPAQNSHADVVVSPLLRTVQLSAVHAQDSACVNPGGGCNGTFPCCDPNENFCVRGICQPVPEKP